MFEAVAPFSGGEKARLVLALVAYQRPNLLLLDEPTNHLDLEMRQALSVALQEYAGAVVLVSHDRHLLNTVADDLIVVHDGRAVPFDGDLEDYARWLATGGPVRVINSARAAEAPAPLLAPAAASENAEQRKQRRREEAAQRNRLGPMRAAVQKQEQRLEKLARERSELERELAAPELYVPAARARLQAVLDRQKELEQQSAEAEAAWLDASGRLESATQSAP